MDFCATTAVAIAFSSSSSSSFLLSSFTFSRIRGIYTSFKPRAINHTRVIPPGVSLHAYLSALHANSRRSTPAGLHLQASLWLLIVDMLWYISFNAGVMWFLQQAKVNDQWGAVTPPPPHRPPRPSAFNLNVQFTVAQSERGGGYQLVICRNSSQGQSIDLTIKWRYTGGWGQWETSKLVLV